MKAHTRLSIVIVLPALMVLFSGFLSACFGAGMTDYCQVPPFIGTGGSPNILVVNDVSGSMSYPAYSQDDNGNPVAYDDSVGYEGYFDPVKSYMTQDPACNPNTTSCLYIEAPAILTSCTTVCSASKCVKSSGACGNGTKYGGGTGNFGCKKAGSNPFGCCTAITTTGDCNVSTGNYLNWLHMHRIDLTRWAITGGSPSTCTGSATFNNASCDAELWNQTGNSSPGKVGAVCNNSLDVNGDGVAEGGCTLEADDGTQVEVRWDRVYSGLAYQFMNLPVSPVLGIMSFSGSGVNANKVYVGDFIASNNNSAQFPYTNFITNINSQAAGGGTPTGPALWDALNYYAQNSAQYGGFPAQTGSGDRWKNPLYICDGQGGNNCALNACARNYVLLMSDGEWNQPSTLIGSNPTCTASLSSESADPVVPAYCMHNGFTNTPASVNTKVSGVYTVGLFLGTAYGTNAMENMAMYGSFDNSVKSWPDSLTSFPSGTSKCNGNSYSGSLCAGMPTTSADWDMNKDHIPDTYYSASNALGIKQSIMDAIQDILSHATSGTAASVLASGEGSGANLVQATYYPRRKFFNASVMWTGGLQNLWYYIDPMFGNSSIREDDGSKILSLQTDSTHQDYIASFYFDTTEQKAKANLYASSLSGTQGAQVANIDFEQLSNLWEAGVLLWNRAATDRTIYSNLTTTQPLTANANLFSVSSPDNTAVLRPLLNTDDPAATSTVNNTLAQNIINYVRGTDLSDYTYTEGTSTVMVSYRPRTVQVDLNNDGNATDTAVVVDGVTMDETVPNVWKLGDIVDSTPKIASWAALNDYDKKWGDATYKSFYTSATYSTRGMVYVGSNDGMLHAFKLGTLQYSWAGQNWPDQIARLTGTNLGKEMWAFIPHNVLPYLQYLADPNYCHIHTVDLTPFLIDASINKPASCSASDYWNCGKDVTSWRTILIGGMKLGGACADTAATCTDCVKTPVSGNGYSAYFALDVTDENNPQLLWEFSDPGLGFSTSGPAIIRISSRTPAGSVSTADGNSTNGRWFVVFGSGPTGPIDTASQKFQAHSDQNLKLFVLDLATGALVQTIDTGIQNAFAGSLANAAFDNNPYSGMDYQDRALYIPYVKQCAATNAYCTAGTWTDGGVLRLLTNQDLNGIDVSATGTTALNPGNWVLSTVMSGIGPVTSAVTNLLDTSAGNLWLYFGTGRYYYRSASGSDDPTTQRTLFGVIDPCYSVNSYRAACLDSSTLDDPVILPGSLLSVSTSTTSGVATSTGWYITLQPSGTYTYDENGNGTLADDLPKNYNAERVITDPVADPFSGVAYFTTFSPYSDPCAIGGKTFIWALQYNSGAAPAHLMGTALIQVSTGAIEQLKLSTAFTDMGGRRSTAMEGLPPTTQGLNLMAAPAPVKKVFHKRER